MKSLLLLSTFFFVALISCKKQDSKTHAIIGTFREDTPIKGRSQLIFLSGNLLIKNEVGSSYRDTFKYSISSSKISLTPNWTNEYPEQQFDFEKIDENTIKIENLYMSIPELPKTFMTFKK